MVALIDPIDCTIEDEPIAIYSSVTRKGYGLGGFETVHDEQDSIESIDFVC